MRKLFAPPTLEISGIFTRAFVDNLQTDETRPIFKRYGLEDTDANEWYPTPPFMEAMNELAGLQNLSSNMVAIGMEIGARFPLAEGHNPTLADGLMGWNAVYHGAHRGYDGDIGDITAVKVTDNHYRTIHTHLYPDDFVYGVGYTLARRYSPPGHQFKVYYDPDLPSRDVDGSETTTIHFTWD